MQKQSMGEYFRLAKQLLDKLEQEYKKAREEGTDDDSYRICSACDGVMPEGYLIDNGLEYYCSDDCLKTEMTMEEWLKLYDDGNSDSYYTNWYEI